MSEKLSMDPIAKGAVELQYMSGLGNEFETEAMPNALPVGQNSPLKCAYGLASELISATSFTTPRSLNRRSYVFRTRPSVMRGRHVMMDKGNFLTPPFDHPVDPNYYAWAPFQPSGGKCDIIESLVTINGNGSPLSQAGMAMHAYAATASMEQRVFVNNDGEMLFILRVGGLRFHTEMGIIEAGPRELVVVPKGIKFRVELLGDFAGGFVCENYGVPYRLPELGLIGTNGLANVSDFQIPVAAFDDTETPVQMVTKYGGNLWSIDMPYSPLNVVAWRGSLYPYKFNIDRFVQIGTITVDHPDPSIFTVLTSPSDQILGPNSDILVLRSPAWLVAEHTFRPPGYHRNAVGEVVMLLEGAFNSFEPGSIITCNNWVPHGPEVAEFEAGREAPEDPIRADHLYLMVIESRFPMQITEFARNAGNLMGDYTRAWDGFNKRFPNHG